MSKGYNGWSNYETWLLNMWYGDYFADLASEGTELDAEMIQQVVEEFMEDEGTLPESGFAADIMNAALRQIDWQELAEHYQVEEDAEAED